MSLARYGTAHEALEDEKNTAVSRRPTAVQDEIVTDERGRRRFHGAFTGGFSAGYFNTVGSRHGWVPQTFKSTRDERAERPKQSRNDFMDDEDKGEFGFAARQIRTRADFVDQLGGTGQKGETLAWERAGPSSSGGHFNDLALQLANTFQGVHDSVGVKILKSMGWRPGKGIGPRMKKRQLEKQKVRDAREAGRTYNVNEEEVKELEEMAPEVEYAPDDISRHFLQPNQGQHGLGYKPLEHSNVLEEDFHMKVDAYKEKMKSKGIRGQAFGVGAFEDEDDDIYTSEDLSKYDFALGEDGESGIREVKRYETNFVPAKHVERQPVYKAPEPSRHFNPQHTPQPIILKEAVPDLGKAFSSLNPLQKAVFLGDRSGSVMQLLSEADRSKLALITKKAEVETKFAKPEPKKRAEPEPFEEEPLKAHRYKKYVHYLKSGHEMPTPLEMTRLEWEEECKQFEQHLTPELRSLLPSVRDRQQPLAKLSTAQPIADRLKQRFQSENSAVAEPTTEAQRQEQDRRAAVKNKRFGELTRKKYTWHPSKYLVKYFNVEDPFPDSREEGCYELQKLKKTRQEKDYDLDNLGLPSTEKDVIERMGREAAENRRSRWDNQAPKSKPNDKQFEAVLPEVERPSFLPPIELLNAVFERSIGLEESSSSSSSAASSREPSVEPIEVVSSAAQKARTSAAAQPEQQFVTVLDLVPDDNEYGPKIPMELPEAPSVAEKLSFVPAAPPEVVLLSSSSDSEDSSTPDSHRRRKRSRKSPSSKHRKHKHKKEKKEKKAKKSKRKRHSEVEQ